MPLADFHVHSIASQDAFSTITEICAQAAKKGLKWVAVTDHGPEMPIGQHPYHFEAMAVLPETMYGVRLLKGVEANILPDGNMDIDLGLAGRMELVIAAYHLLWEFGTPQENTQRLCNLIDTGAVDIIAHLYHPVVETDFNWVVKAMAAKGVALELNEKALLKAEPTAVDGVIRAALKENVYFALGSDAHYHMDLGQFDACHKVIKKYSIPETRIINSDEERIRHFLGRRCRQ